ncbi:hypothetical protein [Streptomyces sp. NPDC014734]|uniref:hypothetical protein n=1 Tax=Streptomyces sp. NPDC014734 TaxID=3364886 RepID=UPI0036FA910D
MAVVARPPGNAGQPLGAGVIRKCADAVREGDVSGLLRGNIYARGVVVAFVFVVSFIIVAGGISYIVRLFVRDEKIRSQGRDIRALVEDVRYVSSNDGGSTTIKYRLSWQEDGATTYVEGRDTISAFRSSQVQKGCEVDIKYLDDDHILFVFDK